MDAGRIGRTGGDGMIRLISRCVLSLSLAGLLSASPLASSDAIAQEVTVGKLLNSCTKTDGYHMMLCSGIFRGFADGYGSVVAAAQLVGVDLSVSPWISCAPEGTSLSQIQTVFMEWAQNNPARWHDYYSIGVLEAMLTAFPCR